MKTEAEIGVMWVPAEERLASPGAGRGGKEVRGQNTALPTPWSQTSGRLNSERTNFCYFKPSTWRSFVTVAPGGEKQSVFIEWL